MAPTYEGDGCRDCGGVGTSHPFDEGPLRAGTGIGAVSRRAFATYDEVESYVNEDLRWPDKSVPRPIPTSVPREGGKVSLPGGTGIEVERKAWSDLAAAVDYLGRGFVREEEWPEVLAAFNAAEEGR
jgi:hypothetical protein